MSTKRFVPETQSDDRELATYAEAHSGNDSSSGGSDDGSRTPPRREQTLAMQRPPEVGERATKDIEVIDGSSSSSGSGGGQRASVQIPPPVGDPSQPLLGGNSSTSTEKKVSFAQKWRFEILVFLGALILFAAIAIMFSQLVGRNFRYHNECITCITGAPTTAAWDQVSGQCLIFTIPSQRAALNRDRFVLDDAFCGAPECANLELIPGVRPIPYWVMIASSLIGIFTSTMINLFKMFIVVPLRRRHSKSYTEDPLSTVTDDVVRRFLLIARILGAMDWYYFVGLYLLAHIHFFIIIHEVHSKATSSTSSWDMYTKEYLLWVNSGTIQVLGYSWCQSSLWLVMKQWQRELPPLPEKCVEPMETLVNSMIVPMSRHPFAAFVIHYLPFFVIPAFWTHVAPGIVVYSPIAAFIAVIYLIPGLLAMAFGRLNTLRGTLLLILMRVVCNFATVCLFQTMVNMMTLLYAGHQWTDVPFIEFNSRSTTCYAAALTNKVQLYNLGFAGLILS